MKDREEAAKAVQAKIGSYIDQPLYVHAKQCLDIVLNNPTSEQLKAAWEGPGWHCIREAESMLRNPMLPLKWAAFAENIRAAAQCVNPDEAIALKEAKLFCL